MKAVRAHSGAEPHLGAIDVTWLRSSAAVEALVAALREINAEFIGNEIDPATRSAASRFGSASVGQAGFSTR
jgi:hypothetical protein